VGAKVRSRRKDGNRKSQIAGKLQGLASFLQRIGGSDRPSDAGLTTKIDCMGKAATHKFLLILLLAGTAAMPFSTLAQTPVNPAAPAGTASNVPEINNPASGNVVAPDVEGTAPVPKPKAKKHPKKASATASADAKRTAFHGKLVAIDKRAMTISVEAPELRTLKITSETHINKDGKPALLAEGKIGEQVFGRVKKAADGSEEATVVNFGVQAPTTPKAKAHKAAKPKTKNAPESLTPGTDTNPPVLPPDGSAIPVK
jgi:hypothetical protein